MKKILVFAGTSEGRAILEYLDGTGVSVQACVATEYGREVLEHLQHIAVHVGRMDAAAMEVFLRSEQIGQVLDATHPYAVEATGNIRLACERAQVPYQRIIRGHARAASDAVFVETAEEAAAYLNRHPGNVLLTTGSRQMGSFTDVEHYQERIYARLLPSPEMIQSCLDMGYPGSHLIAMQGPFSREMNTALLRQYRICYMVTKESGDAGGFMEKQEAARQAGCRLIVIGRPQEETGLDVEAVKHWLSELYGIVPQDKIRKITCIGIGAGTKASMTGEAWEACCAADVLIGAKRMLECVRELDKPVYEAVKTDRIIGYIESHPEYKNVAVLFSGDTGFYSGSIRLTEVLGPQTVRVIPGISTVSAFFAALGKSWEHTALLSMHGRSANISAKLRSAGRVFTLTSGKEQPAAICRELTGLGWGDVLVWVGENLSYPNQQLHHGTAAELADRSFASLCAVYLELPNWREPVCTHGIEDEAFLRGKVPMTKEEVRSISVSKLRLRKDSIIYDIGSGSGSVAVEMALQAEDGHVYAAEQKDEAAVLTEQNRIRFRIANMTVLHGKAPQILSDLPVPTHAFIGGSSGNLQEILELLLERNPNIRIVLNIITLETLQEFLAWIGDRPDQRAEVVQINISKARELGRYHLMTAANPIYLIAFGGE